MAELLLAASLAACAKDPNVCSYTELDSGKVVLTVCDVSPGDEGPPISFNVDLLGKEHLIVLEPSCKVY